MKRENNNEKRAVEKQKRRIMEKTEKSGGKSFGRIWFSSWWPVLLVVVLFLAVGTSVVYQIQAMLEEQQIASTVDTQRDAFNEIQYNYDREALLNPETAHENAVAALEWYVNLSFYGEDMGVYLCERRGDVIAEREPALYLSHAENLEDENVVMRYYRCADKDMEQQVFEAYEAWKKKMGADDLQVVVRIDEAYLSGTECYPVRVNIYYLTQEQEACFRLQETITAKTNLAVEDGIHLTNLDIVEDGDDLTLTGMGRKISEAKEAGIYYPTNMNFGEEDLPKLSENMKEMLFPNEELEDTDASDEIMTYESVSASHNELRGEDNKMYKVIVMPVFLGDQQYNFVFLKEKQGGNLTDLYIALGWMLGILFSAFIALVIAKGFARTMKKEQELVCRQRDYTNALAHDLKTPLMAISGYTENLQSNMNPEKQEHYYEAIYSNIDYMSRLIMDMLSLARLQRPEENVCKERIELRNLAEMVTDCFERELEEKNLYLEIQGTGYMEADPQLMERALKNLIENAVKYSPAGEAIRIRLEDDFIQITNTGVTLPKEKWNAVFQPYVKGDEARERESGIGLGLAIVKDIVELHGFQCSLECTEQATIVTVKR